MYQLARTEHWTPEQLEEAQFSQIEILLRHADAYVPFWRDRLRKAGIRPGAKLNRAIWSRLPVLTRREAQDAGEKLYASAIPDEHGGWTAGNTSGSTGIPLRYRKTELHGFYWFGFNLRVPLWHGMDFSQTSLVIRRIEPHPAPPPEAIWFDNWGADFAPFRTGRAAKLDLRLPVTAHLEWILREKPAYITSLPSNIVSLARLCREKGLRLPSLRAIIVFAEMGPDGLHARCRDVFGVDLIDAYTASEVGFIALQCPGHTHMHIMAEGMMLEVLDDNNRPCAPGGRGRVVATPLHNYAMPLLRYEVGDLAEVGPPCPCGRGLPVLNRILGKSRDYIIMPDGERRTPSFSRAQIYAIPEIMQHQIVQVAADTLEIRMIARRPLTTAEEARLTQMIRNNLGHPFNLTFTYLDEIPREPSGKYKDFISLLPGAAHDVV
jgi:phenylacetate-CoA ligase